MSTEPGDTSMTHRARDTARGVRELYERLEREFNGQVWTTAEITMGFTADVGQVTRLVLAAEGTWPVDGDLDGQLRHKLAECLWWTFVLADRLGVDMEQAYTSTMDRIQQQLGDRVTELGL